MSTSMNWGARSQIVLGIDRRKGGAWLGQDQTAEELERGPQEHHQSLTGYRKAGGEVPVLAATSRSLFMGTGLDILAFKLSTKSIMDGS